MKIGYTTGVFDMFHIGHLNIIKNAKSVCDYLIVGVTSDQEVLRIKKKMPIIPYEDRSKIVESIKYVDRVVKEDNVDKLLAWEKYNYDILIKGNDWERTETFKKLKPQLAKRNVEVVFFEYTKDVSSTSLRKLIKESSI